MTRHLLTAVTAIALLLPAAPSDAAHKKHHAPPAPDTAVATTPSHGSIHGAVRAGSQPLSHITVRLLHKNHAPAHTNKSGEFSFHDLRPGVYTLVAHTKHHGSARAKLAVDAGTTTELVLPLRAAHHLHHLRPGGVATPGHTPGHVAGLRGLH